MDRIVPLTRAAGLNQLSAFLADAGPAYAGARNIDRGPDARPTTSALSPYLRRRLITEAEVAAAVEETFGDGGGEKFISEVFWRSYFKGHLETHPGAWTDCLSLAAADHGRLADDSGLRRTYAAAIEGRTGIEGFDDWARELVETGWLHNHARMWFASIWIFTLRLPWALGADFFMRHLLDGDPASNTLSWRWVAGLHTRGKHYVARRENIRRYTDGRFDPVGLDEYPDPLDEAKPPREVPLPRADATPVGDVALLLHLDDLNPETIPWGDVRVVRVGGLVAHSPGASDRVRAADDTAMADALKRAEAYFDCPATPVADGWDEGCRTVTAWAPVGPTADALPSTCLRVRRQWDEAAWPSATRGYSRLRKAIPGILSNLPPAQRVLDGRDVAL
jgi:deoxyribodipyrimidine photo-lyase